MISAQNIRHNKTQWTSPRFNRGEKLVTFSGGPTPSKGSGTRVIVSGRSQHAALNMRAQDCLHAWTRMELVAKIGLGGTALAFFCRNSCVFATRTIFPKRSVTPPGDRPQSESEAFVPLRQRLLNVCKFSPPPPPPPALCGNCYCVVSYTEAILTSGFPAKASLKRSSRHMRDGLRSQR